MNLAAWSASNLSYKYCPSAYCDFVLTSSRPVLLQTIERMPHRAASSVTRKNSFSMQLLSLAVSLASGFADIT